MDIKDLKPDQLADVFRRGRRAAEDEAAQAEHARLVSELEAAKVQSRSAFDARAEIIKQEPAAEAKIASIEERIAAAEQELENAKRERAELGRSLSDQNRIGKDLARRGRPLEEELDVDAEARGFVQNGWYVKWPNTGGTQRPEEV